MPWARIVGILGIVVVAGSMTWLTTDPAFSVDPATVAVDGLRYTAPDAVRAQMRLTPDARPATVVISTRSLETAIEQLPTVASARVRATLPDRLSVTVTERQPIVAWKVGDQGWLVDVEGNAFAPADALTPEELGDGSTGSTLPALDDRRAESAMTLGARLDPIDLEVVRTLGNLTPEMISSEAPALTLTLDDDAGWVLRAPGHWRAVFGHYTQTLIPPSRIPSQVQCLKSLLQDREDLVEVVTLAASADRCGSFRAGAPEDDETPRPARTPRPERSHRPGRTTTP